MVSQNSLNNQVLDNDFTVTQNSSGGDAFVSVANLSNTASSDATLRSIVAGTSGGDAKVNLNIAAGQNWTLGLDNSDSDAFVLSASSALGTTNVLRAAVGGNVSVVLGDFDVTRSASGSAVSGTVSNTSNTASSNATQFITVAGTSAGDAQLQYAVAGTTTWTEGIDNSDSDAYVLAASSALGTTNVFRITTAGAPTFPLSPLDVPSGGTTKISFTAFAVICGGTTSTGALQNVSGVGTAGQVLTSNGAGLLPTWQAGGGGGGSLSTLTGNTGGAISPTGGNIDTLGTGSITIAGSGSTLTTQLTGLTNHSVLVGAGTATITKVAPSTAGIPLVSNGAAADPSFTTALVVGGGTGATSFTPYSVITAGTVGTGAFQNVSGVGTSGQVLTSNGAAALPTWTTVSAVSAFKTIVVRVFTADGTYIPTPNMIYCTIEVIGGGGGGGGVAGNSSNIGSGAGGGGGGYARKTVPASTIGASITFVVGAGGAGGVGNATGGTGGTTSVNAVVTAFGGVGGAGSPSYGPGFFFIRVGGNGGAASGGDFNTTGGNGGAGITLDSDGMNAVTGLAGCGGETFFGGGGNGLAFPPGFGASNGNNGTSYGGGGGGGHQQGSPSAVNGGDGFAGVLIITEFVA